MKSYDLAIIGSGPGGYVAGLYASRRKLKVSVIEKGLVGGTCLNRGCIPTKSFLNSASIVSTIKDAPVHGIAVDGYKVDFEKVSARKDEVVSRLRSGIETLFRANHIALIRGRAILESSNTIKVEGGDVVSAKYIIIAAGSVPAELADIKFDGRDVLSSDHILDLKSLPKSVAVIGGGVIGCEFASLLNSFGSKVTIVEVMDRLISTQSREVSKKLEMVFKKRGMDIFTSSRVDSMTKGGILKLAIAGKAPIEVEKVLVAVGRAPDTKSVEGLDKLGIKTEKGRVVVEEYLRTSVKNIYAIGDCVNGPMLAHKASYDGMLACDNILGGRRKTDYSNIPNCIWTDPEIASVGLTEEEARSGFPGARVAKFPYLASGKAFLSGKSEGFVKMIGDNKGNILGVEILGHEACDLIGEAVLAKTMGINIKDWAKVVHGHPTLSEIFQEAAHVFCGTAIHGI